MSDKFTVGIEIIKARAKSKLPKYIIRDRDGDVLVSAHTEKEFKEARQAYLDYIKSEKEEK